MNLVKRYPFRELEKVRKLLDSYLLAFPGSCRTGPGNVCAMKIMRNHEKNL
jgi:hypothetical protein